MRKSDRDKISSCTTSHLGPTLGSVGGIAKSSEFHINFLNRYIGLVAVSQPRKKGSERCDKGQGMTLKGHIKVQRLDIHADRDRSSGRSQYSLRLVALLDSFPQYSFLLTTNGKSFGLHEL